MSTEGQGPTPGTEQITIDCNVQGTAKKDWNCCHLLQYCAKIDEVDDQVRRKSFEEKPEDYAYRRRKGNAAAKAFKRGWNRAARAGTIAAADQEAVKKMFYHDCAYEQAKANDFEIGSEFEPDHVQEIQAGGSAGNITMQNLRWLADTTNGSVQSVTGTVAKSYDPSKSQSVKANCCPAENTFCKGKTPSQSVLP